MRRGVVWVFGAVALLAFSCGGRFQRSPGEEEGPSNDASISGGPNTGGAPPRLVPPFEPDPYDTCVLYVTDLMWQSEGGRLTKEEAEIVCSACDRAVVECYEKRRCWMAYCFPEQGCTCSAGALCIERTLVAHFEQYRWSNNCLALEPGYRPPGWGGMGGAAE